MNVTYNAIINHKWIRFVAVLKPLKRTRTIWTLRFFLPSLSFALVLCFMLCWMWLATFSREPCTKSVHNLKFYTLFAKLRNLTHWLGWHSNFVELFIHSILENFFVFHSIRFASRINIEYRRSRWRQVMHVILMGDHCPYDFCCFIVYALIVVICKWTEHTERERGKNQENLMNK